MDAANTRNVPLNLIQGLFQKFVFGMRERHRLGGRCDVQERQCVKLMSIVGKRNMALMRNNEMHEMDVDCSMRQTHEMSP